MKVALPLMGVLWLDHLRLWWSRFMPLFGIEPSPVDGIVGG